MVTIVERRTKEPGEVLFVCDFSPPRGSDAAPFESVAQVGADYVCAAYNPGKATRVASVMAAAWLQHQYGQETVITVGTRDMNRLALQSLLLGADLLGLQNILVLQGDPLTDGDRETMQAVDDFVPTSLLASIRDLNEGKDFRGRALTTPTTLCPGATIDLGRDLEQEVRLTQRKVEAGAQFFLVQPPWMVEAVERFLSRYERSFEGSLPAPLFVGVQVMTSDSLRFGDIPASVIEDLDRGRPSEEIALEGIEDLLAAGFRSIYLVPPIMRGGRRDYATAQGILETFRER